MELENRQTNITVKQNHHQMLKTVVRRAQVKASTGALDSLSKIHELPSDTGAGLFVEYPEFQPLGTPPTLLHVSLPASTVLNSRTRSIVALNGHLDNVSEKLSVLNLWQGQPLLYNQVTSTTPLSVILSDRKGFVNLPLKEGDYWTVMHTDDITGWYGSLEMSRATHGVAVKAHGRSNLILTGSNQVFTLTLDKDESISVNPSSIVAFQGVPVKFHKLKYLELPNLGIWNTLKNAYAELNNRLLPKPVDEEVKPIETTDEKLVEYHEPTVWSKSLDWVSTKLNSIVLRNRVLMEIQGPGTVIVQNDFKNTSQTFTQEQLTTIYKQIK